MAHSRKNGPADDFSISPLEIIDPIRWQGQPVPERRWLWEGWIPLRGVTVLSGDGGTGKSLLALQIATACATGRRFLDQRVMHCKSMVIACEDEADELHRRQARVNAALGLDMADLSNLALVSRAGQENVMMEFPGDGTGATTPLYDQILAQAREMGAQLIVLDTAADLFGGNENVRPQVRQFFSALTRLALAIDGAVLLLAHPSQSGRASGTGESGSTAWNNSSRSRLYLLRPDVEKDKTGKPKPGQSVDMDARILTRQKSNYSQAGVSIPMRYAEGAFAATGSEASYEDGWTLDRKNAAKAAFLAGLEALDAQGFEASPYDNQAHFAPKAILAKTTVAAGFDVHELGAAMDALIREGRVTNAQEGSAKGKRTHLRIVQPELDGLQM